MNTLKNIGLAVIFIVALSTFVLTSCQASKEVGSSSCCPKKATVDKCTQPSQKSECCKKK
jgi:hypothetical protein